MLGITLQNKAAKAAPGAKAAAAKLPTIAEARENLGDLERAAANNDADLRQNDADTHGAISSGNTAHMAELRTRSAVLYNLQAQLAREIVWAQEALTAAEAREGGKALEQEIAALSADYQKAAPRVDAGVEAVAALHREQLALNGKYIALQAKCAAHARRYGSAPAMPVTNDLLRWPTGFLGVLEKVVNALTRLGQHREFLGDAKTEAQATHRQQSEWYKQDRERRQRITQKILDKAGAQAPNETMRIYGRRPGAAA